LVNWLVVYQEYPAKSVGKQGKEILIAVIVNSCQIFCKVLASLYHAAALHCSLPVTAACSYSSHALRQGYTLWFRCSLLKSGLKLNVPQFHENKKQIESLSVEGCFLSFGRNKKTRHTQDKKRFLKLLIPERSVGCFAQKLKLLLDSASNI
jgi:hypothetical protein